MSQHQVQFEEDALSNSSFRSRKLLGEPVVPPVVRKLVEWGMVKDYDTAGKVLLVVVVLFFLCALGLYIAGSPHRSVFWQERAHTLKNAE